MRVVLKCDLSASSSALLDSFIKLIYPVFLIDFKYRPTDRRIDDVYGTWASQDQAAALSSFAALPAGEARSDALRGLVSATAATNPQAAVTLMDRFPTDVTDRVVQNFIWQSYDTDPTTAASQISRIQDEHGREQMYRRVLSNWIDTDPAIAQAWIQANPVPQTVLDRIVNGRAKQPK